MSCQKNRSQEEEASGSAPPKQRAALELILENPEDKETIKSYLGQSEEWEAYHWKNHLVLLGRPDIIKELSFSIKKAPVKVKVNTYNVPFYVFDKGLHCDDGATTEQWNNYLLTANLVADTSLQQEYMDYHARQFQDWPEVSQGFCHADFQQLLLFRNERQLLLVISVPADKTLDELNPKTTENNPRVDDWNALMSQYQEGIEGKAEDEVWVFLQAF
ncbi:hypothetical protein GCM10028791_36990 [Echinicola sediminis]